MMEAIKYLLLWVGVFHVFFAILGFTDLLHYRLYIGTEDRVIISKKEYEQLKALRGVND